MQSQREQQLASWLETVFSKPIDLVMVSGDASFRRYFRFNDNGQSYIAVDAPPDKEPLQAFIEVTLLLQQHAIQVPVIFASDREQGFMALSDLGNTLFYSQLLSNKEQPAPYAQALHLLEKMHQVKVDNCFPKYDRKRLLDEMDLLETWFFSTKLQLALSNDEQQVIKKALNFLADAALAQPQVFVHRDYHSRNLMVKDGQLHAIDYQDAVLGPYTYDLVSLLKDCYLKWPAQDVEAWAWQFCQAWNSAWPEHRRSRQAFLRDFDLMGLQRHLKVLGVFSRLALRDNKKRYLLDIPRVLAYCLEVLARYAELADLQQLFILHVLPKIQPDKTIIREL